MIAVPVAHLPPELLIKITGLASPAPEFDFLETEWASAAHYGTLKALCLTSRTFCEIARPRLYRHVVVRAAEAGRALVRTLGSDERNAGEVATRAQKWVKVVALGQAVPVGGEVEGGFVSEVLGQLERAEVQRVAIIGVRVEVGVLAKVGGKSHRWESAAAAVRIADV